MSITRIEQIEKRIQGEERLDATARQELLALLGDLKSEMEGLDGAHGDHSESIASFAGAAAHEAMRSERNPDLLNLALEGLSTSVKAVEADHPRLVDAVNGICTMLSNLGI